MAEKRKMSIRKILQLFVTLVVTVCCVIAMVSASRIEDSKMVTSVAVHIRNDKKYHFVEEKEIMDLAVNNRNIDLQHTPVSRLDLHTMEKVILANPWISHAQVYIDNERVLHMYITQRIPIARVFQQNAASYYLDTTLSIMPLSAKHIYYTSVVTNVPQIKNDSAGWAMRHQIVSLVRHIQSDSFWSAQISQVIVDSNGSFELLPVIGNQRILFGEASDMHEKFGNLFVFYKNVLNRIGWDKYETLDLRYKDQVVALPSLPYKGPVDKAVANMNWINSIVETEAVNDTKDSIKSAETKAIRDAAEQKRIAESKNHKIVILAKPSKKLAGKMDPKNDKKKVKYVMPVKPAEKGKEQKTAPAKTIVGAGKPAAKPVDKTKEKKNVSKVVADKNKKADKPGEKKKDSKENKKPKDNKDIKKPADSKQKVQAKTNTKDQKDKDTKGKTAKYVYPEKKVN